MIVESKRFLSLVSLFVLGLTACTNQSSDQAYQSLDASEKQGIIGGTDVESGSEVSRQTVLFFRLHPALEEGHFTIERCTGTLVAPKVVLTAAHCVPFAPDSRTIVFFDADPQIDFSNFPSGNFANVTRFVVHPLGNSENDLLRVDLAFMLLDREAPSDAIFARIPLTSMDPEVTEEILVAGYGRTNGGLGSNGDPIRLREALLTPLKGKALDKVKGRFMGSMMRPSQAQIDKMTTLLSTLLNVKVGAPYLWMDQTQGKGACLGDSGGPVFVKKNDRLLQAGVTSFSIQESPMNTCRVTLAAVNLSLWKEWIDTSFNQINGSTDESLFVEE